MMVVDSSAVLEILLQSSLSQKVWNRISGQTLAAPYLIDLEIVQVVRRYAAAGDLSATDAQAALDSYRSLRLERYPHLDLLERIWELRHNLTAYDASYVALAEVLNVPLVTCDAGIGSLRGHNAQVVLLGSE